MKAAAWIAAMGCFLPAILSFGAEKRPWKDATVEVGDIKIRYIEMGSGDRTITFIPGWTMPAEVWQEQLPYFAARGFRAVAFDPRSHGQTTKTEGGNTYQQHAADLNAFLKTLKLDRGTIVGWSAGVTVLLDYIASPEASRPEKLVLVDGSPCGFREKDCPGGMIAQQARSVLMTFQEDRAKFTDKFVRSMFKNRPSELIVAQIASVSAKVPAGAVLSLFMDLYTGDRRPALARIEAPTLVVVPQDNRLLGEYLQSKVERSRLSVIEGAGHALFLEKPQAFNQALEDFLAGK